MYLYGYNSEATKPPFSFQGFNLGANEVLFVSLINSAGQSSVPQNIKHQIHLQHYITASAFINITAEGYVPGDPNHPLQFDDQLGTWYVRVTAASSSNATTGVHYHLGADNFTLHHS